MGSGYSGNYSGTKGSEVSETIELSESKTIELSESKTIELPENDAQLKHIFGDREGHLPDTQTNRGLLVDLANDSGSYVGKDKYGNKWNVKEDSEGRQLWVRHRNSKINEGGRNDKPREWDDDTGLNDNPFKKKGK